MSSVSLNARGVNIALRATFTDGDDCYGGTPQIFRRMQISNSNIERNRLAIPLYDSQLRGRTDSIGFSD